MPSAHTPTESSLHLKNPFPLRSFWKGAPRLLLLLAMACLWTGTGTGLAKGEERRTPLEQRAGEELREIFSSSSRWVKVHAAEALIDCGFAEEVEAACRKLEADPVAAGYPLTGFWRVMARCTKGTREFALWRNRLLQRALDRGAKDWILAMESLGKLGVVLTAEEAKAVRQMAEWADPADALYAWWLLVPSQGGGKARKPASAVLEGPRPRGPGLATDTGDGVPPVRSWNVLTQALHSENATARIRAGFILRELQPEDAALRRQVGEAAAREPRDSAATPFLVSAALSLDSERHEYWLARLKEILHSGNPRAVYVAELGFLPFVDALSRPELEKLLMAKEADPRIGAAGLILKAAAAD